MWVIIHLSWWTVHVQEVLIKKKKKKKSKNARCISPIQTYTKYPFGLNIPRPYFAKIRVFLCFFFFFFFKLAFVDFFMVNIAPMHCLRTHKLQFLVIFSLKIGHTVLFTHLKIISLQCFYFQFSVSAKINCIQTDPNMPNLKRKMWLSSK